MKRLSLVLLCFYCTVVHAQFEKNYFPAPVQDTIPSNIQKAIKSKLTRDKARVAEPTSQVSAYVKELYEKRSDFVIQSFNSDYFIDDQILTPYLQSILDLIYKANPQLEAEGSVYTFRSETPNAMSFGEGTMAFTLGLLARMESEAQIAFVLCHELAHYHARHSDIKTIEFARLNYDKELKKKVKAISKSEYGQHTKFSQLTSNLGLSINQHSREKEFEADSLALLLYLNTNYDLVAPIRTLEILDSADISLHPQSIDIKKHFDFAEYPFKDPWLQYTPSLTWHNTNKDLENDSLRTHPRCKQRIAALHRQLKMYNPSAKNATTHSISLADIRMRSEFEMIESANHFQQYGNALFQSLILLQNYPDNAYLHATIGQCMYQLYSYQKNHELGRVLSLPDSRFDENYDRFLTYIHTLRLMELASLSYYYTASKMDEYGNDERFMYALWLVSNTEVSKQEPDKIKSAYQSKFPSGKYLKLMK